MSEIREWSILELLDRTIDKLFSLRALIAFGNTDVERYKKGILYLLFINYFVSTHKIKIFALRKRGWGTPAAVESVKLLLSRRTSIFRWRNVPRFPSCNQDHMCRLHFSLIASASMRSSSARRGAARHIVYKRPVLGACACARSRIGTCTYKIYEAMYFLSGLTRIIQKAVRHARCFLPSFRTLDDRAAEHRNVHCAYTRCPSGLRKIRFFPLETK